jgi:hypothetical protein
MRDGIHHRLTLARDGGDLPLMSIQQTFVPVILMNAKRNKEFNETYIRTNQVCHDFMLRQIEIHCNKMITTCKTYSNTIPEPDFPVNGHENESWLTGRAIRDQSMQRWCWILILRCRKNIASRCSLQCLL